MEQHKSSHMHHYRTLGLMLSISFVVMYGLMYSMTNRFTDVFMNVNQVYMAALMAAPMALIELALMPSMYPDKRLNTMLAIGAVIVLIGSWIAIDLPRAETGGPFAAVRPARATSRPLHERCECARARCRPS